MGEPLLGAVGPQATRGAENLSRGVEAELGEGLATELDLDPGDIRPGWRSPQISNHQSLPLVATSRLLS
jgi:hypothetical protein